MVETQSQVGIPRFATVVLIFSMKVFVFLLLLSVTVAVMLIPAWIIDKFAPDIVWLEMVVLVLGLVVAIVATVKVFRTIRWETLKNGLPEHR